MESEERSCMNYVDLILLLVVALAVWAGWRKGFILGTVNLLIWIGSLFIGFVFYTDVSGLFQRWFPSLGVWNTPLAFIATIVVARVLLSLVFTTVLKRTPDKVHTHGANRFMGIFPGAVNGFIYATIIAAVLLTMPLRNGLSTTTKESAIANRLAVNIGWLDEKFSPIFGEAVQKSLTRVNVQPESHETVNLNFS